MIEARPTEPTSRLRLDKWLWAARFFKTRALAVEAIERGRVQVNDQPAKPSRDVRPGDRIGVSQPGLEREVVVLGISASRGPASVAQLLYRETPQSVARREAADEQRRLSPEPALAIAQSRQGRPTKRDRRDLAQWERWSARLPDDRDERR